MPEDVALLREAGEAVSKYPGTHLFKQGQDAVSAFVIERGEIDIYRTINGRKRIVARVGPGSVLGDIAMFGEGTYVSSAQAVGHVEAYRLDRDRLLPQLAQHPAICMRWLVSGLRQLEETQRRVLHLMRKTVIAQVADLLLEEATRGQVRLSQEAMATLLGSSRQSVNQALAAMKTMGAIETGYRRVVILDEGKLRTVSAESA